MKRLFALLLFLALCLPLLSGGAEEEQTVYILGNFAFGMPLRDVRALDKGGAALIETDAKREVQRLSLLSDNFVVSLWFQGLTDEAPLTEMDFAFFMSPDTVILRDGRLEIQTAKRTVNTVYAYVESLCKKTFGRGTNAADNSLPFSTLLFEEADSPDLTRLRIYTLPDGKKTDMIVHLIVTGDYSVNYLVCRQSENEK